MKFYKINYLIPVYRSNPINDNVTFRANCTEQALEMFKRLYAYRKAEILKITEVVGLSGEPIK